MIRGRRQWRRDLEFPMVIGEATPFLEEDFILSSLRQARSMNAWILFLPSSFTVAVCFLWLVNLSSINIFCQWNQTVSLWWFNCWFDCFQVTNFIFITCSFPFVPYFSLVTLVIFLRIGMDSHSWHSETSPNGNAVIKVNFVFVFS